MKLIFTAVVFFILETSRFIEKNGLKYSRLVVEMLHSDINKFQLTRFS